jgi:hypothetical protein
MPPPLFPPSPDRPTLDWVAPEFPYPLALTYRHVHLAMDRQQAVEAVWCVRDALECAVKFVASLAVADFPSADPPADMARLRRRWPEAAADVLAALRATLPLSQAGAVTASLQPQVDHWLGALRQLTPDERAQLDDALGENTDMVRRFVESSPE